MTAFLATAAMAQEQPKDMKKEKTEWEKKVKDELNLTPEQVEKYDALNKEYDEKFTTISQDASLTKEAQKERIVALKKEKNEKFYEFLTPEQQAKHKEMVDKKMKEKGMAPKQY
jgi:Spy/CpxP family protein refolding chaperone